MAQYRFFRISIVALLILNFSFFPQLARGEEKREAQFSYRKVYKKAWTSKVKRKGFFRYKRREFASPVADGGRVFVGSDRGLFYAFDLEKGKKLWVFDAEGPIHGTGGAAEGRVFFGDNNGILYALEQESGEELWRESFMSPVQSAPLLVGNRLYGVTLNGTAFALEAASGQRIWTHPYEGGVTEMTIFGQSSPAYDADTGRLYMGYSDGSLVALNSGTGSAVWRKQFGHSQRFIDIDMRPLVDGDRLYFATFAGKLFCVDKGSGAVRWSVDVGSGVRFATSDDRLFVGGSDGALYAFNKMDGMELWKTDLGEGALTRPIFYKELLAVGSSKESMIFIDSLDGYRISQRYARKHISGDPILSGEEGNLLLYLSNGARLYAIKLRDDFRKKPR